jgi:hypothetical protein
LSYLATLLIGLPVVLGLAGEQAQSIFFDIIVACLWGSFLWVNQLCFTYSMSLLIVGYLVFGVSTTLYVFYYRPLMIRKHRESLTRVKHPSTGWKKSGKVHRRVTQNPFRWLFDVLRSSLERNFVRNQTESSHQVLDATTLAWRNMNQLVQLHQKKAEQLPVKKKKLNTSDTLEEGSDSDESEKNLTKLLSGFENSFGQMNHSQEDAIVAVFAPTPHTKEYLRALQKAIVIPDQIQAMRVHPQTKFTQRNSFFRWFERFSAVFRNISFSIERRNQPQ